MKSKPNSSLQARTFQLVAWLLPVCAPGLLAGEEAADVKALRQLSLEEIMNMEITSVSKKEQKLSQTSAAISVITSEDLRRDGITKFQDALRLVPGLEVAQIGSQEWAISIRGFNDMFANKLLVMVDGRSIYTPLFSGVFWNTEDLVLEDIERIEVIRGPGASVWGANAVNGVINIIRKQAKDTQGTMVSVGGGYPEQFVGTFRQGEQIGESTWVRYYGRFRDDGSSTLANGQPAGDEYWMGQAGFRLDHESAGDTLWTLQGDGFYNQSHQTQIFPELQPPYQVSVEEISKPLGGNILGRWTRQIHADSEISVQTWLDYSRQNSSYFESDQLSYDLDVNYRSVFGERHDVSMGGDFRITSEKIETSRIALSFADDSQTHYLASFYVQDDWAILPDTFNLTYGAKFEYNDYTGMEMQPTFRMAWTPDERNTLWGAISRAVRTPSIAEDSARIVESVLPPGVLDPNLPAIITVVGDDDYDSESVIAYELGYRVQATETLNLDTTIFYNSYSNLRGFEQYPPAVSTSPPAIIVPYVVANNTSGHTYGAELAARWQATDWWQWRVAYTFLEMDLEGSESSISGKSPQNQFSIQSLANLPYNLEFDGTVRYVGELSGLNIPSYLTLDLRLGWRPVKNLELSLMGRNLIDSPHQEFAPSFLPFDAGLVQRSVFLGVRWDF